MNNVHRTVREAERPGLEPVTSRLQIQRPNHRHLYDSSFNFVRFSCLGFMFLSLML